MIMSIVKLPAVGHINNTYCNFNRTVVLCPKMNHHHRSAAFLKSKNTTNSSGVVLSNKQGKGHANKVYAAEKPNLIYGGHFNNRDTPFYGNELTYRTSTNVLGPKFELALETGMDETIGIDLVAMSLNDLVTVGPCTNLIFIHDGTSFSEKVISCMADACKHCGSICYFCQTEMPYTTVAIASVKKDSVIDGKNIEVGDVLIGLPSSGIHSNGFSLVRRVLEQSGSSLKDNLLGTNITLGESLMTPTIIYNKQVLEIISKGGVKGIAHIAGGGLTENITCVFPTGLGAVIFNDSWVVPPIFKWIQETGRIEDVEMRRTFNMGIGMMLVVSKESACRILGKYNDIAAYHIGEVVKGHGVIYQ